MGFVNKINIIIFDIDENFNNESNPKGYETNQEL